MCTAYCTTTRWMIPKTFHEKAYRKKQTDLSELAILKQICLHLKIAKNWTGKMHTLNTLKRRHPGIARKQGKKPQHFFALYTFDVQTLIHRVFMINCKSCWMPNANEEQQNKVGAACSNREGVKRRHSHDEVCLWALKVWWVGAGFQVCCHTNTECASFESFCS